MGEEGSVFGLGDAPPPDDDCFGGFEFEADDEDLTIDLDTIYRILDEKPDSAEGSQGNSSPDELKNPHLLNGSQMVDWTGARTGLPDDHVKMDPGLSPSPARTCSASLKDWFSSSQDDHPLETCGVSQSEMTSCSISSSSLDRYNTCFSDHAANMLFNPLTCDVDVSNQDVKIIDSKFTSCSPTMVNPYFDNTPGYGVGLGADYKSSVLSGLCHYSSSLSDGVDNSVSSAQDCYNKSGASLAEQNPNFVQNFAFQFFPNKEEAGNDVESGVSECQSDGASRMIFDRHGRLDNGHLERKPAVGFSNARGISFNCESNQVSPACVKPYTSFDCRLADNDVERPDNCSSSFQDNEDVHVKVKSEAKSEKVVYSSVAGENSGRAYATEETNHWWSSASSHAYSYQTDVDKGYSYVAPQTAFPNQDCGDRSSNKYYDSKACLQYVAADPNTVIQSNEYSDFLTQKGHEHIHPRSIESNFSNASFESIQSHSSECISDSDDDSDICIIETNGQSTFPHRPLAVKNPLVSSQYSTLGHTSNQSGAQKLQSNKENMIYQAALQDLSQPNAEANAPDGVLTVPLLRHQRIALSWMVQKETSGLHCSGGILADDQGLGKTVSTIALILKERSTPTKACEQSSKKEIFDLESESGECAPAKPSGRSEQFDHSQLLLNENKVDGDSLSKVRGRPAAGTLVVCPTSVMRQWADELHKKVTTEANLSVLVYHGSGRTKDPYELAKYDVVVTTYSIVSMEVPKQPLVDDEDEEKGGAHDGGPAADGVCSNKKRKYPPDSQKRGSKKKKHVNRPSVVSGPLAKVSWFRVVLDEAQSIKNYKTQVARACWGLRAKRRWCLSGTPIQNSIEDLYSYFRFLKHDPFSSYVKFCNTIKNPISRNSVNAYQKLQVILKTVMLRRTKGSLLDGKPIISLPPKSIELRKVDFTEEERDFYSKLEAESRSQFQEYAEAGTVKQNYVNILLMLLRLRQACDHPLLVNGEHSFTWESSVESAKKQNLSEASLAICGICNDAPEDAVVSVCSHVFCKQCIYERLTGDNNQCPVANCNVRLTISSLSSKTRLSNVMPSMLDRATSDHVETVDPCSEDLPYGSSKIKAALQILQALANPQDMNQISQNGDDFSPPVTPVKNEGGPTKVVGEKAIVFSQWTKMLDLLEACLISSRIQYRRLDGTMSVAARDKAVQDFNTLPEVSVMIMSLKAASLGLNMVAACHVLMLDLWWNPTTEDQAIDRAHRIGQTRPVTVVRFTVKDTVEDRILALQEKKRRMVASAFGEDEKGSRQSHLTVEDLSYLFMAD